MTLSDLETMLPSSRYFLVCKEMVTQMGVVVGIVVGDMSTLCHAVQNGVLQSSLMERVALVVGNLLDSSWWPW